VPNNNVYVDFSQALFFSGAVAIPRFLLDNYHELGMTGSEMMFIIHLLNDTSENKEYKEIKAQVIRKMGISESEYYRLLQGLQDKKLVTVISEGKKKKTQPGLYYDFSGLFDQLLELWGINQFKQLEKSDPDFKRPQGEYEPSALKTITGIFEEELGRPLTGFECEHIEKWLLASYSQELILEALRRGVSAGIRNFRYLDSILREWEKKGIRTIQEVEVEDQHFQAKQAKKIEKQSKSKTINKNKYNDIYL